MPPRRAPISVRSKDFTQWRTKCLAELAGAYAMSFFGPATVVLGALTPGLDAYSRLSVAALATGSTLSWMIFLLSKYSGAHVNPAITVTFTSARTFGLALFFPYVAFQFVGGLLAGLSLKLIFGSLAPSAELGSTKLASGVNPIQGIVFEAIGTFALCLVVLYAVAFVRGTAKQAFLAGAALFLLILVIGPITGGSFNPVRSLGPALFAGYTDYQYVYLVGPISGAAVAGVVFGTLRRRLAKRGSDPETTTSV